MAHMTAPDPSSGGLTESDILTLVTALASARMSRYPGEARETINMLVESYTFQHWLADHLAAARRDALLEAADCVKEARRHGYVGGVPSDPTDVRTEAWLRSLASAALDPVTPTEAGEGTP